MRVRLRYEFFGQNAQTTLEKAIALQEYDGISSYLMTWKVLVPSTQILCIGRDGQVCWSKTRCRLVRGRGGGRVGGDTLIALTWGRGRRYLGGPTG